MPIFGRRQIREMLDEIGDLLSPYKAKDLLDRLNSDDPDQTIPAEYELALTRAVSRIATVEVDRRMGRKAPDIYSVDLLPGGPVAADVAALSDASFTGEGRTQRAIEIINRACDAIVANASRHLHYTFLETSGYFPDEKGVKRFKRHRRVTSWFKMDSNFRSRLNA